MTPFKKMKPGERCSETLDIFQDFVQRGKDAKQAVEDVIKTHTTAPFQKHSKTSREAAKKVEPRITNMRGKILLLMVQEFPHGATDEDFYKMGFNPNSFRPRRVELVEGRFIEDTGQTRLNDHGNKMTLWRPTKLGVQWAKAVAESPAGREYLTEVYG